MTRVVPEPLARGAFLPFVEQLANLIQLLRGGRPGGEGLQDELERRAVQPKSWRLDARDRLGARRELGQPRGLGQERVRAVEPVLLAALHHVDLAGQSEKRGRPVPGEDTLVEQARRAGEERLLHLRRLRGQRLMVQPVTPGGGQEHAGVELQRPSPETLPVDHAHSISLVENMTGVKRAVNKAPRAVLGQRLRQYSGQPPRGPSEPAVRGVELNHFLAGVVDHVSRTQGQPDLDRQRRGAPQPARGQLSGALPPPAFEELLPVGPSSHPMARTCSERSRARSGGTRTGPSPTRPTAARASYSSASGSGSSAYSLSAK